jgi:hypothetical protein
MSKVCTKCKILKPLDAYSNDKTKKKDGKYSCCKSCKLNGTVIHNAESKVCSICNEEKKITEFGKELGTYDGYKFRCKKCFTQYSTYRRNADLEKAREKELEYYHQNKEKINKIRQERYPLRAEHVKQYNKIYCKNNREKINAYNRKYRKRFLEQNPYFKLAINMRQRIRMAVLQKRECKSTKEYLGCSVEFLRNWFEHQFTKEMSWENYGSYWHIDHVEPCASFDLSKEENIHKCFCWKNTQPLSKEENLKKRDKYDEYLIKTHHEKVEQFLKEINNDNCIESEDEIEIDDILSDSDSEEEIFSDSESDNDE